MLNRADLARDVGISGSTTAAWLSVLAASGQVAFLSGVCSPEDLRDSPQAGALWETLVFGELRRLQIDRRGGWELHFWRDRAKEGERLIDELGEKAVTRAAIICRCRNQFPLPGSIPAIPLGELPPTWA
ncbi:MAG: DUF4143 domain-containing protein [Spirochaetes bacterium]|nr:DUF4143 domain-containing protein [Spirochaetota bacterium]